MSQAAGIILAIILLGVYGFALSIIWRAPFRALGVLVAGMAVHNFLLMVLLRLGTPGIVIRVVQAWKEGILLLLLFLALRLGLQAYRRGRFPRLLPVDIVLAAFVLIAVVYFVLPGSLLGSTASLSQRDRSLTSCFFPEAVRRYCFTRCLFSGTPMPVSVTENRRLADCVEGSGTAMLTETKTLPCSVNLIALPIRLINT